MEREFREVVTPIGKHKIKIKEWLTGFEKRRIQGVFLDHAEFNVDKKETSMQNIKGEIIAKSQDVTIEVCIAEIDGKKENILETVGNMHSDDFDFVLVEIDKVAKSAQRVSGKKK